MAYDKCEKCCKNAELLYAQSPIPAFLCSVCMRAYYKLVHSMQREIEDKITEWLGKKDD